MNLRQMYKKNLVIGGSVLVLLTIVSITSSIQNLGWAAPINCAGHLCHGTSSDDVIIGSNFVDFISGLKGNDKINGQAGNDDVCGDEGNDTINGAAGDDRLIGDDSLCKSSFGPIFGADNLVGGPGNDVLVHGTAWRSDADGNKDILDCGSGLDTAFANITIDHDVVTNCEQINPP